MEHHWLIVPTLFITTLLEMYTVIRHDNVTFIHCLSLRVFFYSRWWSRHTQFRLSNYHLQLNTDTVHGCWRNKLKYISWNKTPHLISVSTGMSPLPIFWKTIIQTTVSQNGFSEGVSGVPKDENAYWLKNFYRRSKICVYECKWKISCNCGVFKSYA